MFQILIFQRYLFYLCLKLNFDLFDFIIDIFSIGSLFFGTRSQILFPLLLQSRFLLLLFCVVQLLSLVLHRLRNYRGSFHFFYLIEFKWVNLFFLPICLSCIIGLIRHMVGGNLLIWLNFLCKWALPMTIKLKTTIVVYLNILNWPLSRQALSFSSLFSVRVFEDSHPSIRVVEFFLLLFSIRRFWKHIGFLLILAGGRRMQRSKS